MLAPTCKTPSATWKSPYTRYPTAQVRALRWKSTGVRASNPTTANRAPPATTRARISSTLLRMTSVPAAIPNWSAAGSGSARVSTRPYISPASARNIRPKMAMATSRSTPLLAPVILPAQAREKGRGHRRRRAPDVAWGRAIDGKNGHLVLVAFVVPEHPAQRLGGGKRFEGDRKDLLHLVGGEHQLGLGREQPDERAHAEVGRRYVHLLQLPDHLDQAEAKVDLLLRLAQRRLHQRAVRRLGAAAGKRDLASVLGEILLPHRIHHPSLPVVYKDRNEHRRPPRIRPRRRHPRTPLPRLQMHRRKALVHVTPRVERSGDRLPQPIRESIPAEFSVLPTSVHHPDASTLRPAAFAACCGPTGLRLSATLRVFGSRCQPIGLRSHPSAHKSRYVWLAGYRACHPTPRRLAESEA